MPECQTRADAPAPSPAAAVNAAARSAAGDAIAVCIDGARMLSPGIIAGMLAGLRSFADPLVATLAWHLGPTVQNESILAGYDQAAEDRLLATVDWRADGYELFRIASLAGSSAAGWFGRLSESNCLAVPRAAWDALGGLDERFTVPGGGLVNLDFYRRACDRAGTLLLLMGEGTFHQVHGGVSTNVPLAAHPFAAFAAEYRSIRGGDFVPPAREAVHLGGLPSQAARFLAHSIAVARPVETGPAAQAGTRRGLGRRSPTSARPPAAPDRRAGRAWRIRPRVPGPGSPGPEATGSCPATRSGGSFQ